LEHSLSDWLNFDIIAEIGGNHEGDFGYAKALTELAISSKADIIKFQIYTGNSLVNRKIDPARAAHFDRFALSIDQYKELAEMVRRGGKVFNASIWDWDLYREFRDHLTFIKIGSGDLTAYPLLEKLAREPKPMIVSTGLSTLAEIGDMLSFLTACGRDLAKSEVALMQCTSMYPIEDGEANLSVIGLLKDEFGVPVGYSDHTTGQDAAYYSYAFGAEFVEVHFTDNPENKQFRDHKVSFTPAQIDKLAENIARMKTLAGKRVKQPTASEISNGHLESFRRGLYPARPIRAGEQVTPEMLVAQRPAKGIPANAYAELLGKEARSTLEEGQVLSASDFTARAR
jgi:N-acetylneuraminate synthase/N,N'-diacetyllegionaminate synthase